MAQASRPRDFSAILDADSVLWGIAIVLAWTLLIAPLALMAVMLVVAAADVDLFHSLIDEDHPIEWAQFFAIAAAAVAFAIAAVRAHRHDRRRLMALYLLIAFACFFVAGEEISWGQRIFHWGTPVVLEEANHQGEANIHNIGVVQRLFNLGELVAGLYGATLPILWAAPRIRARLTGLDAILVPPICTVVLFALPFAYRTIRLILLPEVGERGTELGEVPELTFYVGVLVVGIATARVLGRRRSLES